MKTILISAASAIFLFGTAFAREVVISRVITPAFVREVALVDTPAPQYRLHIGSRRRAAPHICKTSSGKET